MIEVPEDLDAAIAECDRLSEELLKAIALCEAEQQAGRIGLEHYRRARALRDQALAFGSELARRINMDMDGL